MEDPVFRLEGIVRSKGENEDFVGPLSVILQLLSKNKIEIADISVSLILEQYLAYLDEMASMDLDVASEFVAMAAHLTYIKTRMLLSGGEDTPELEELISTLEQLRARDAYVQIKLVAEKLAELYLIGGGLFVKPPEALPPDMHYKHSHGADELLRAITEIRFRVGELAASDKKKPYVPHRAAYPLTDKIAEILERVRRFGVLYVAALFWGCRDRSEAVATFVAVLELCKAGDVTLAGEEEEMTISCQGAPVALVSEEADDGNS